MIVSIFPGDLGAFSEPLHIVSYLLLGAFAWSNRRHRRRADHRARRALNFIAITANGGVMPADPDALAAAGLDAKAGEFANSAAVAEPEAAFLGDIVADAGLAGR